MFLGKNFKRIFIIMMFTMMILLLVLPGMRNQSFNLSWLLISAHWHLT